MGKDQVYVTLSLPAESTGQLFRQIKKNSDTTWANIEKILVLGTGSNRTTGGGGKTGHSAQQFSSGRKRLPRKTACRVLGVARGENWISKSDYFFYLDQLEDIEVVAKWEGDVKAKELDILIRLEKQARRLLQTLCEHPDLGREEILVSIDKILFPMINRLVRESNDGKPSRNLAKESFDSIFK